MKKCIAFTDDEISKIANKVYFGVKKHLSAKAVFEKNLTVSAKVDGKYRIIIWKALNKVNKGKLIGKKK